MDPTGLRAKAAVRAGVRVLVLYGTLITLQWLVYLGLVTWRRDSFLRLVGPDVTWLQLEGVFLWMIGAEKVLFSVLAMAVLGLALWERELRRLQVNPARGGDR